jgi:hypothetical protein
MGQRQGCKRLFSPYFSVRVAGRYNETSRQARLYMACVHDRFLGNVIPKNASGLYSGNVNDINTITSCVCLYMHVFRPYVVRNTLCDVLLNTLDV